MKILKRIWLFMFKCRCALASDAQLLKWQKRFAQEPSPTLEPSLTAIMKKHRIVVRTGPKGLTTKQQRHLAKALKKHIAESEVERRSR